jgi:hypothetical protein
MLLCAWIGLLSINGRAQGGLVAEERVRESRSPFFKFKSSLKDPRFFLNRGFNFEALVSHLNRVV